jgi:transposase
MIDWLSDRGISFSDRMCKPELYSLNKLRKPRFKRYKIYALLAEHGHSALRLPPYHPDLNPTELI